MVGEIDKATEARRKALRNGEEDPVVVAQRFLNIYRQMHIFSPERKEAFNKMLLELSPEIQGLFSSLPGGIMLQDYVDDLVKKTGGEKNFESPKIEVEEAKTQQDDTSQQAEILATALAKAQSQVNPTVVAAAPSKVSMDKDFAEEFAKIIGSLLEKQTIAQKESLEKITTDISKTQLFLAKNLKETKDEQHQDINTLLKNITDIFQAERTQQRQDLGEICKIIAQSQTALSLSMKNQTQAQSPTQIPAATATTAPSGVDTGVTQKLIDMFLEGQKQLNARLEKVEIAADAKFIENEKLLKAFEQTQTTLIKKMEESIVSTASTNVVNTRDDEKLVKMIAESQENLVKTLLTANLQQNNTAQANNNANNIQITTPDNSAQMLLFLDKITSMQNSNQQSLEKALVAAIKEQGEIYNQISAKQTKELASVIAESLKNVQTMYVPVAPQYVGGQKVPEERLKNQEWNNFIKEEENQDENEELTEDPVFQENSSEEVLRAKPEASQKKKKKKKKNQNRQEKVLVEEQKSISNEPEEDEPLHQEEEKEEITLPPKEIEKEEIQKVEEKNTQTEGFSEKINAYTENKDSSKVDANAEQEIVVQEEEKKEPEKYFSWIEDEKFDEQESSSPEDWGMSSNQLNTNYGADDWGFGEKSEEETSKGNNEDFAEEGAFQNSDTQDEVMEAIGDNSYIGISSSYEQQSSPYVSTIVKPVEIRKTPIIFDDTEEEDETDPYQNSILKD